jgi:hypothetical protein
MSIELTREQLQAAEGSPLRVTDPETSREYFVVDKATYERLQELGYDDSPWTDDEMDALAWEAGKHAGWDDPRMDECNDYDPHRKKP